MDPLSSVLSLLKPRSYRAGGFDLGGNFAINFPKLESVKCFSVVSGQCWLSVEGVPDAVRLTVGDCFLLPRGLSSCLASDLTLTPVDARTIFPFPLNGRIASYHGGGDCLLVGGNFVVSDKPADVLLAGLPPIVHPGRVRPARKSVSLLEKAEVTPTITDLALEKHYTVGEIAERWHVDYSTARAMFENEPGVLRFGPEERRFKRSHVSLRAPESVMVRVHRTLQRRAS